MFDLDRFVEDCRAAVREDPSHKATREVLARANSDPDAILTALGEPTLAGVTPLYRSDTLTILNVVWGKRMTIMPHDHRMWAVIGVYTGREDNIFWRRLEGKTGGLIEAAGAKSLGERCAEPLGRDVIHSVTNPLGRLTAAIHVYGGDFYGVKRSDWGPENLLERDYDFALHQRMFEEANADHRRDPKMAGSACRRKRSGHDLAAKGMVQSHGAIAPRAPYQSWNGHQPSAQSGVGRDPGAKRPPIGNLVQPG